MYSQAKNVSLCILAKFCTTKTYTKCDRWKRNERIAKKTKNLRELNSKQQETIIYIASIYFLDEYFYNMYPLLISEITVEN